MSFFEFRKKILEEKKRRQRTHTTTARVTPKEDTDAVRKSKYNVALLGLERAGKTSLVKKLLKQDDIVTRPTYGVNIENYKYRDLSFSCFDLGGHKPFRMSLWKKFIERSDAIMFLVDSADTARFEESKQTFWHYSDYVRDEGPVLFLANKSDLRTSKDLNTIHEFFELDKFLRNLRPFHVARISAKTGQGVYEAWDWLVDVLAGDKKWKVRISGTVLANTDGKVVSEVLFGRPDEQAKNVTDFRKLKEQIKLFAIESRESIQSVKLESLYKKHASHVKRGGYCLSVMIDPIDPVTRAQQIQLRILEHFSRNTNITDRTLEEVLLSKFPLEVKGEIH